MMSNKKISSVLTTISVAIITLLAWLSGFFVMEIVYDSVVASIVFGTVVAVIVFCESRFSYISLKSDGRISISKEEVKSNFWQMVAASLVAAVVSIPLLLKIFEKDILLQAADGVHNLGVQLSVFLHLFSSHWFVIILFVLVLMLVYNMPTILKMTSEE